MLSPSFNDRFLQKMSSIVLSDLLGWYLIFRIFYDTFDSVRAEIQFRFVFSMSSNREVFI